jgi:Glyoxalase-like domain
MKIDHVTVGGRDIHKLEDAFAAAGMKTEYGGPHSSGLTEMSLLGFDDGSYIELISAIQPPAESYSWKKQIEGDGGPCAWAIGADNIAAEAARIAKLGIKVAGPADYARRRPDGVMVEWQLAFLGEQEAGAVLPFIIQDKTPRNYRVKPSQSVTGGPLKGVTTVIISVESLEHSARLFRRVYNWPEPEVRRDLWGGVRLASFTGTPVILASSETPGWLSERLQKFGESPCAFLIQSTDLEEASRRHTLERRDSWFGDVGLRWVKPLKDAGMMIGIIGP